jgi:hypothetical protein
MGKYILGLLAVLLMTAPAFGAAGDPVREGKEIGSTLKFGASAYLDGDITIQATTGQPAILNLYSDAAEDNSDKWRVQVADGGNVTLETYQSGAWVAVGTWSNAGGYTAAGAVNSGTAVVTTSATVPTIYGSSASGGDLTLEGSSDATNGDVLIQPVDGLTGIGTASPATKLDQAQFSADALGSYHTFSKSRHATAGSHTIVQDNDVIGGIKAAASDGTDFGTIPAQIHFEVDDAAPAASSIGGALVFSTAAGAAADDLTERMRIDKSGNVTMTGTANVIPTYKTIFIPAASMTPTSTNGALPGTTEYVTNDINKDYLAFDATTEQYADVSFPMPEGWNRSTVKVKFYWTTESGSSATDTVEWEIAAVAVSDDDPIDTALGSAVVISDAVLADDGTDLQISGATPALTVGGTPALGDLVHWKVSRNVSGTDDCAEDGWLFGILIQYLDNQAVAAW